LFRSSFHPFVFRLKLAIKIMVKREGMENLLLRYYEGETTEDETALIKEWLDSPPDSDTRSGGGHGADFIQAGCKEGLGGCTS
jgi:hypothetical protein